MTLLVPARARVYVYGVFGVVGLGIGSAQVGYAAADLRQPVWLIVALAVYAYVGGAIGYTAVTHTPTTDRPVRAAGGMVTNIGPVMVGPDEYVVPPSTLRRPRDDDGPDHRREDPAG